MGCEASNPRVQCIGGQYLSVAVFCEDITDDQRNKIVSKLDTFRADKDLVDIKKAISALLDISDYYVSIEQHKEVYIYCICNI